MVKTLTNAISDFCSSKFAPAVVLLGILTIVIAIPAIGVIVNK